MSTHPLHPRPHSILFRLAQAACPPPQRPWLAALVAESSAIDSPLARLSWQLGVVALVFSANLRRGVGALREHPVVAMLAAVIGAGLIASPSLLGFELMDLEDDWFLVAGSLFGASLLSATAASLVSDVRSRALSGGRHPILP